MDIGALGLLIVMAIWILGVWRDSYERYSHHHQCWNA